MSVKKKINKNIALLEYGGSHTECMYFQIRALKEKGYNVFLICNTSLLKQFPDQSLFEDILLLHEANGELSNKEKWEDVRKIRSFTKKHDINTVVINSIEHRIMRNVLIFPLPKVKNYVGIIHYTRYLNQSGTFKWLYRKVKKVFFLSDYLLTSIKELPRKIDVATFYPIYLPSYDDFKLDKPENEFWLCSPGAISEGNKDVATLLDAMTKKKLNDNVKIILLGSASTLVQEQINKMKDTSHLVYFDGRISQSVMDAYMKKCDAVLPLMHPEIFKKKYGNERISGTYNLAYAYQKPMLMEKSVMDVNNDFKDISISYELDDIIDTINYVSAQPEEYKAALRAIQNHPYLNIEKQSEKYLDLIEK